MSDLRELYQEVIIDHGRNPRNFSRNDDANRIKEGYNPLCGDKITVFIVEENNILQKINFVGCGCAISMASASLMSQAVQGKTIAEAESLFEKFHQAIVNKNAVNAEKLGKLIVSAGVAEYPARVKCATLAWHTMHACLTNVTEKVSTE